MRHKSVPVEMKSAGDSGEFTALVSAFGNVDLVGDRILPGAFDKTLARYRASGDPIPIVISHQWDDVMAHIGKADANDARETAAGLEVTGKLDLDNPLAKQTFRLMKERRLKAFSFGYTVPDGGEQKKKDANEITEIDLVEVGPTLKGANPEAQLQAVKSALELEAKKTSPETPEAPIIEDRENEEPPPEAKSRRQDDLADKTDRMLIDLATGNY